jgi:hypothetical protein
MRYLKCGAVAEAAEADAVACKAAAQAAADMQLKHVKLQQDKSLEFVLLLADVVHKVPIVAFADAVHLFVRSAAVASLLGNQKYAAAEAQLLKLDVFIIQTAIAVVHRAIAAAALQIMQMNVFLVLQELDTLRNIATIQDIKLQLMHHMLAADITWDLMAVAAGAATMALVTSPAAADFQRKHTVADAAVVVRAVAD